MRLRYRKFAHRYTPGWPYTAPHTAKIHTLITLGIGIRAKALVFKLRIPEHVDRGFRLNVTGRSDRT